MRIQRSTSRFFALAAIGILSHLCFSLASHAESAPEDDSPDFIRRNTWDSSFDKSADAVRQVEHSLEQGIQANCGAIPEGAENDKKYNDCVKAEQEARGFQQEAAGIRKTQRVFAHVSRASDVAAVGAIGTVGYQELMKKDASQADSLKSVAKIQETAGYVSYTTGAADFSMGAYAFAMHKQKLERMKDVLGKANLSPQDASTVSKLTNAAELSKQAAYNHMLYGAGKAAFGYASMYMAKENKKAAEKLESIDVNAAAAANAFVYHPSGLGGTAPYYQNNTPQFYLPNSTNTSTAGGAATASGSGGVVAGGGASVLPSDPAKFPTTGGKPDVVASGAGAAGAAPAGGSAGKEAEGKKEEESAAAPARDPASRGFEVNLTGGGLRYGGGSNSGETTASDPAALLSAVGGDSSPASHATGLNPGRLFSEATEDLDGNENGSMAGVSSKNNSLFETVRTKYHKMMEGGRVQGPGAVEVRN